MRNVDAEEMGGFVGWLRRKHRDSVIALREAALNNPEVEARLQGREETWLAVLEEYERRAAEPVKRGSVDSVPAQPAGASARTEPK